VIGENGSMGKKFIIAGGGTGGHLFPALAIGDELRSRGDHSIHYVGSYFGIEAKKLPQLDVEHTLLPIRGLQRSISLRSFGRNLLLPGRLISSKMKTRSIFNSFQPDAVIGTGGYASALPLHTAKKNGIPHYIQEQNSFPGMTTRHFAENAEIVFTAFNEVEDHLKKKTVFKPETPFVGTLLMGIA